MPTGVWVGGVKQTAGPPEHPEQPVAGGSVDGVWLLAGPSSLCPAWGRVVVMVHRYTGLA